MLISSILSRLQVERQDFMLALEEVVPAFGAATEEVRWSNCDVRKMIRSS